MSAAHDGFEAAPLSQYGNSFQRSSSDRRWRADRRHVEIGLRAECV